MIKFLLILLCIIIAYPLWVGLSMWLYAIIEDQPMDDDVIAVGVFIPVVNIGLTIYLFMYKFMKK
jgi:hypothetical protein